MSVRLHVILLALVTACVVGMPRPAPARPAAHPDEIEDLRRRAVAYSARNSIEARRMAVRCLEQATLLAPERADLHLELGRLHERMGYLKEARKRFERVARLAPTDPDARMGLARIWRRDYLKYVDSLSLEKAIEHLEAAARLRPADPEVPLNLVPLLLEHGDLARAGDAVARARDAAPARNDVRLADALVSYHLGRLDHADSAFQVAIPRLTRAVRERFDDIAPLASERDTMTLHRLPPAGQEEFVRRFWADLDPDFATPVNEARLAYWARVAQAYFLYYDTRRREWDQRGEVYVRYGPPATSVYNPVGGRTTIRMGRFSVFPLNLLVWSYPELGMNVVLEDRLLTEYYLLPMAEDYDPDPVPDPEVLARQPGRFATRSGRGVFPTLPPGVTPVPLDGVLARFEGTEGPRLLSLLEIPGAPGDSSTARFVVLDSTRREVARGATGLAPSACDPAAARVADFTADLPPGAYVVGLTVENGRGGRGVLRRPVTIARPRAALALSDVVVSCGRAQVEAGSQAVRLTANPSGRVAPGQPLTVYFEIYHLRAGDDGLARVEFEYTVRSAQRDRRVWIQRVLAPRRGLPDISSRRQDVQVGDLRRQFVEVPVQSLPPGPYRLEITVRDLVAGTEVAGAAAFTRSAAAGVP